MKSHHRASVPLHRRPINRICVFIHPNYIQNRQNPRKLTPIERKKHIWLIGRASCQINHTSCLIVQASCLIHQARCLTGHEFSWIYAHSQLNGLIGKVKRVAWLIICSAESTHTVSWTDLLDRSNWVPDWSLVQLNIRTVSWTHLLDRSN